MAKRKRTDNAQDLSSFMAILIMTIGALVTLLVSNTLIIISNPENTQITSIITSSLYIPPPIGTGVEGGAPFPLGNKTKEPTYLDVYRDRVILYPGKEVLPVRDLERPGNVLEERFAYIEEHRNDEYIVLLVRPGAAVVARRLAKAVRDRGIDLGVEPYEAERHVNYTPREAEQTD